MLIKLACWRSTSSGSTTSPTTAASCLIIHLTAILLGHDSHHLHHLVLIHVLKLVHSCCLWIFRYISLLSLPVLSSLIRGRGMSHLIIFLVLLIIAMSSSISSKRLTSILELVLLLIIVIPSFLLLILLTILISIVCISLILTLLILISLSHLRWLIKLSL